MRGPLASGPIGRSQLQNQLPLNVRLQDEATVDNFLLSAERGAVLDAVRGQLGAAGDPVLHLAGPPGTGKSHLLQAACHLAGLGALYLPLKDVASGRLGGGQASPQQVLEGAEYLDLVCLDDLDVVVGLPAWEEALFHLYNRARERSCRLLIGAVGAPRTLALQLPDLLSRLTWGTVYQLTPYSEQQRIEILQFRAARRGLRMPSDVAMYILNRAPRDLDTLIALLEQLDVASLAEQRRLTIPFVRRSLGWA